MRLAVVLVGSMIILGGCQGGERHLASVAGQFSSSTTWTASTSAFGHRPTAMPRLTNFRA